MVLYVVLTDLHAISEDQIKKLAELGGCSSSERAIYHRGASRHLRLAVNDKQTLTKTNLAQTYVEILSKPDVVKKATIPDIAFSQVMDSFFNKAGTKKEHIMLAQVSKSMKMQLPSTKPAKLVEPSV